MSILIYVSVDRVDRRLDSKAKAGAALAAEKRAV
jgi:hypothetical protein